MYAVIFRAQVSRKDHEYEATAAKLRELALKHYGCREFVSCSEGENEISLSYWDSQEQILAWKQNVEHRLAQSVGRAKWYRSYSVEVTKIVRAYGSTT